MIKNLRFLFVALLAMVFGSVMAADVTIATNSSTFSASGDDYVATSGDVTLTYSKGTATSPLSQGVVAAHLRVYKNALFTISSDKDIATIVVTAVINNKIGTDGFTADGYTAAEDKLTGTWTGNAKSITLTASGGQVRLTQVEVTFANASDTRSVTKIEFTDGYATRCTPGKDETVALPEATVMAGETAVVGANVTWTSSNEEIAPIVDGVIKPVNGSQGSVTITATYAGNDNYKASAKSYTLKLYKGYVVLAELVKDLNSTNEKWDNGGELASFWMGELVNNEFKPAETLVTYASGNYTYLSDGTNHMLFYGTASVFGNNEQKLKAGDKITMDYGNEQGFDAIWGTAYRYNKLPEFKVEQMVVRVASENNEVAYTTITADQISDYVNAPIKIESAKYDSINGKNVYFHVGETKLNVYNQFGIDNQTLESLEVGATYTLSGMGCVYKETYQIYLINFVKTEDASVNKLKAQNLYNGAIYNLRGQRIITPGKGLYIKDGKKYFVK